MNSLFVYPLFLVFLFCLISSLAVFTFLSQREALSEVIGHKQKNKQKYNEGGQGQGPPPQGPLHPPHRIWSGHRASLSLPCPPRPATRRATALPHGGVNAVSPKPDQGRGAGLAFTWPSLGLAPSLGTEFQELHLFIHSLTDPPTLVQRLLCAQHHGYHGKYQRRTDPKLKSLTDQTSRCERVTHKAAPSEPPRAPMTKTGGVLR